MQQVPVVCLFAFFLSLPQAIDRIRKMLPEQDSQLEKDAFSLLSFFIAAGNRANKDELEKDAFRE